MAVRRVMRCYECGKEVLVKLDTPSHRLDVDCKECKREMEIVGWRGGYEE